MEITGILEGTGVQTPEHLERCDLGFRTAGL